MNSRCLRRLTILFTRRANLNINRNEGKTQVSADSVAQIGNVRVADRVGT